jgi:hypothetical protein
MFFVIVYLRQKNEFGQNPEETLYLSGPVNIIHLLHADEGNMKMYSPKSIIFPAGNARGEYDTRG